MPKWKKKIEAKAVELEDYRKALADELKSLACSSDADAPYIVRSLVKNDRIEFTGAQAPGLVEAILDPKCSVAAALTDADKSALKRIASLMRPAARIDDACRKRKRRATFFKDAHRSCRKS